MSLSLARPLSLSLPPPPRLASTRWKVRPQPYPFKRHPTPPTPTAFIMQSTSTIIQTFAFHPQCSLVHSKPSSPKSPATATDKASLHDGLNITSMVKSWRKFRCPKHTHLFANDSPRPLPRKGTHRCLRMQSLNPRLHILHPERIGKESPCPEELPGNLLGSPSVSPSPVEASSSKEQVAPKTLIGVEVDG